MKCCVVIVKRSGHKTEPKKGILEEGVERDNEGFLESRLDFTTAHTHARISGISAI